MRAEAGRATIAETIVPMLMVSRKLILIGDHKQLRPFGVSQEQIDFVREELTNQRVDRRMDFEQARRESDAEIARVFTPLWVAELRV